MTPNQAEISRNLISLVEILFIWVFQFRFSSIKGIENNFCFFYIECNLLTLNQKESSLRPLLRVLLMAHMLSWMFRRPVSSAKWNGEENLIEFCKSFMYKRKSRGLRTDTCGTPKLTFIGSDEIPSIEMYCILLR